MIPKLTFGRTGHESSRLLFGAVALHRCSQAEADKTMELVIESGINHIDTAASYGESELRLGPWTGKYRERFFIATKTGERKRKDAFESIERSLERMKIDQLDLIQFHGVLEDKELEEVLGLDGALEAGLEAREKGLVRFIGITSHGLHAPAIHMQALARYDFDSVLLPWNYLLQQNPQYARDFRALETICREKNVALQMIKTASRRLYVEGDTHYDTWYLPFETQPEMDLAIHWALAQEGNFINTSGDNRILPLAIRAAQSFRGQPTNEQMEAMLHAQEAQPLWS